MKKSIRIIMITALSLVLLTGCSSAPLTKVSNGDEVLIDIKDNQILKKDIYKYIKLRFGPNLITSNLIEMQLDKYVTLEAADLAEGQKRLDETKELLKEDFEKVIMASGYKSVDDYYERVILNALKNEKLFNDYLANNLETITEGLSSAKIKKIRTNSKPEAEAALAELNAIDNLTVADFESVAKTYSQEEVVAQSRIEHVYEGRTVLKFLNTSLPSAKPGLINEVKMDGEVFYIVFVEELNLESDKEMLVNSIVEDQAVNEVVGQSMFANYSAEGDFTIHDADLYDLFKESNPFLIK